MPLGKSLLIAMTAYVFCLPPSVAVALANTLNIGAFRRTLIYQSHAPIADVQADLRSLGQFHDRLVRQYNYATVALILCISLPVALLFALSYLVDLGWMLILGMVLAAIAAGTVRSRARRSQFSRDRDRLLSQVLELLQRDMALDEPLAVKLSVGHAQQAGPPVSCQPHPILPGWQVEHYRDLWFSLQGEFLDQTRFSLELVEKTDVPHHHKDWGKGIGQGFDLTLQCQAMPQVYGSLAALREQWAGAVQLPPGASLTHCQGSDQGVLLTAALPPAFTASLIYQAVVMLLLSAYQGLNLARHLAHTTPSQGQMRSAAMGRDGRSAIAQLSGARSGPLSPSASLPSSPALDSPMPEGRA